MDQPHTGYICGPGSCNRPTQFRITKQKSRTQIRLHNQPGHVENDPRTIDLSVDYHPCPCLRRFTYLYRLGYRPNQHYCFQHICLATGFQSVQLSKNRQSFERVFRFTPQPILHSHNPNYRRRPDYNNLCWRNAVLGCQIKRRSVGTINYFGSVVDPRWRNSQATTESRCQEMHPQKTRTQGIQDNSCGLHGYGASRRWPRITISQTNTKPK